MIASTKIILGAALIGTVAFAGTISFAQNRAAEAATALSQATRTPDTIVARAFAPFTAAQAAARPQLAAALAARKSDRLQGGACALQTWPYIAHDCLVAVDGTERRPVRTVTVERRPQEGLSVLVRMPEPRLAQR
jgi:hypothetical protein